MKRYIGVLASAAVFLVFSAASALAQTSTYPPPTSPPTSVMSSSGSNTGGGTAFTGGDDVSIGAIMLVLMLAVGLAALFVARRRATRLAV